MAGLNRFEFIGNLTRDAEVRYTGNDNRPMATLLIAVDDVWFDGEGRKHEATDFFRIKVWGKPGEDAGKYLGKGSSIHVEGRIKPTEYTPQGGSEKVYGTDYIAQSILYLNTKKPASAEETAQ